MTDKSNGIVIVTVGLPGAGKTSFCRAVVKELSKNSVITCRHVCYDAVFSDRNSLTRHDFCWKSERRTVYDEVASWLSSTIKDQSNQNCTVSTSDAQIWLLIDDNMYYRSMRYPYYQLARENRMAYVQVHMSCSLDTAVQQNQLRPNAEKVPAELIERMSLRMQAPLPAEHSWEKWTIFVDRGSSFPESYVSTELLKQLHDASQQPAPPFSVIDLEAKERQRQMTKESLLHQADLMLRRIVGEYFKSATGMTTGQKYSNDQLRKVKLRVLEKMKTGSIDMTCISEQDIDTLRYLFADFLSDDLIDVSCK